MIILHDFIIRAALAGSMLAVAAGPLGCFILWRRMAYFGDAVSHGAILGVALALATELPVSLGTMAAAIFMALTAAFLAMRGWAVDIMLGVLSHTMLALGMIAAAFVPALRTDLSSWLFGDILAVGQTDLYFIGASVAFIIVVMVWRWQRLLSATLSPDLALTHGVNPLKEHIILMLMLGIVVAVAIKIVGALLISAMLIIPAAAARPLARSPEHMLIITIAIGIIATGCGLALSLWANTPAGPSIIASAAGCFTLSVLFTLPRLR